jgi:hypothetical protein
MAGFARLTADVLRSDWKQFGQFVIKLTGALIIFMLVFRRMPNTGTDMVKGMMLGVACASTYGWAQMCFTTQRYRGLIKQLLENSTPMQVVISKYASALSMSLFTINVPGIFMPDLTFMFYLNSGVLLLTSVCMAATIISDQSYAPLIPLIILAIPTLYMRDILKDEFAWIVANATPLCIAALCAIPLIIYFSGKIFEGENGR